MGLNRQQISQIYRPVGPKMIWPTVAWSSGGKQISPSGTVDLTWPARALRFVFKGRIVIGTAGFGTVYPHGFLELIQRVYVYGVNSIAGGQITLCDMPLSVLWDLAHMFNYRAFSGDIAGTVLPVPTMPYPSASYNPVGATGTYDFRIVWEIPFHPFSCPEYARPGFLVRGTEWKNTLTVWLEFGTQAGGGATGCLGISGGTTTITYSGYGSGAGTPTIDVYAVPAIMGLDLAPGITPGVISRVGQPINTPLQSAGSNINLLTLQNRSTPRLYLQTGVLGSGVALASLSDTNVTNLGVIVGANKNVRNKVDVFAHKLDATQAYGRDPIQGSIVFDFMESQNSDSSYPADKLDASSAFQLVADVTGAGNAYGIIVQEQQLFRPEGSLYTF